MIACETPIKVSSAWGFATVTVTAGCIATAAQTDPSYSPGGVNVYPYVTHCSLLFCSLAVLIRGLATPWTYFLHLSLSSVIRIDSSTESPVHVLMLTIQAVRDLPRLRAPGIVPCIISFSRQLPCFLTV